MRGILILQKWLREISFRDFFGITCTIWFNLFYQHGIEQNAMGNTAIKKAP